MSAVRKGEVVDYDRDASTLTLYDDQTGSLTTVTVLLTDRPSSPIFDALDALTEEQP